MLVAELVQDRRSHGRIGKVLPMSLLKVLPTSSPHALPSPLLPPARPEPLRRGEGPRRRGRRPYRNRCATICLPRPARNERGEGWGEGLFLGSWSQCMRRSKRRLAMNWGGDGLVPAAFQRGTARSGDEPSPPPFMVYWNDNAGSGSCVICGVLEPASGCSTGSASSTGSGPSSISGGCPGCPSWAPEAPLASIASCRILGYSWLSSSASCWASSQSKSLVPLPVRPLTVDFH
jgi:hypothetical protein